jgi:hypothetical protein
VSRFPSVWEETTTIPKFLPKRHPAGTRCEYSVAELEKLVSGTRRWKCEADTTPPPIDTTPPPIDTAPSPIDTGGLDSGGLDSGGLDSGVSFDSGGDAGGD